MESLKGNEAKLELEVELPQIQSESLNEAVSLNLNRADDEEATRRKKMKRDNEQEEQDPVLMNSDDNSIERVNIFMETVAAQVGRNPLLVTIILKMMDTVDVWRNCRLVNLAWCDLSTFVLLKRKSLNVSLARQSKSPPYQQLQHFASAWDKDLKLGQLTKLITPQWNSRYEYRFPCVNFAFDGDLNSEDAQDFLDKHGKNIKGLILIGKSNPEFIRKLLVEQVRNLESLFLEQFEINGDGSLFSEPKQNQNPTQNSTKIQLPSLTCFEIDELCLDSLVQEIVQVAPNLQKCKGIWQIEDIQPFLPRIYIFKEVSFTPRPNENGDHLALWESLNFQNLQVKILYIDYTVLDLQNPVYGIDQELISKVDGICSKLLEANRLTLKTLHLFHSQEFESRIQWPKLKMVKELVIKGTMLHFDDDEDDADEEEDGAFALKCPTLEISHHFPNLETLSFCSVDTTKSVQIFNGELLSLHSLSISEQPELFNQCYQTFPNIVHLVLSDLKDVKFPQIAPNIWTMKYLYSLHLDLKCSSCSVEEIDAVFTGMEKNTCEFLRTLRSKKTEFEDSEVDKLRVRPSILNLTELRFLVLSGKPKEQQQQSPQGGHDAQVQTRGGTVKSRGPSFVSFEFAFNLMPELRVSERYSV